MLLASSRGGVRLLGTQALSYAAAASGAASAAGVQPATITLPNGKALELAEGDVEFAMPPEWAAHSGCWVAWPRRHDVWRDAAGPAKAAFGDVIRAIAQFEPVTVVAPAEQVRQCKSGGAAWLQAPRQLCTRARTVLPRGWRRRLRQRDCGGNCSAALHLQTGHSSIRQHAAQPADAMLHI